MWALIEHPILSDDPHFKHGVCLDTKLLYDYENKRKKIGGDYSSLILVSYTYNFIREI